MRLKWDLDRNALIAVTGYRDAITSISAKRADSQTFELQFDQGGVVQEKPDDSTFKFGIKIPGDYQGTYLVFSDDWTKTGTGVDTVYTVSPSFNTWELNDYLVDGTVSDSVADQAARYALTGLTVGTIIRQDDTVTYWKVINAAELDNADGWQLAELKSSVTGDFELEIVEPDDTRTSTGTIEFIIPNDINRGSEGIPTSASPAYPPPDQVAVIAPTNGNYRIKNGTEFQIRETSPTAGWRSIWTVNGVLQFGTLEIS